MLFTRRSLYAHSPPLQVSLLWALWQTSRDIYAGRHHHGHVPVRHVHAAVQDISGLLCARQLDLLVPVAHVLYLLVAGLDRPAVCPGPAGYGPVLAETGRRGLQFYCLVRLAHVDSLLWLAPLTGSKQFLPIVQRTRRGISMARESRRYIHDTSSSGQGAPRDWTYGCECHGTRRAKSGLILLNRSNS